MDQNTPDPTDRPEEAPRDPAFFFEWRGVGFEWRGARFSPVVGVEGHCVVAKGRLWSASLQLKGSLYRADGVTPAGALEAALCLFVIEVNNLLFTLAPGAFVIDGKERRTFSAVETRL